MLPVSLREVDCLLWTLATSYPSLVAAASTRPVSRIFHERMVAVGPIVGAVGVSLLAFGCFHLHAFLQGIRAYRERTKSETCVVPALHFLQLLDTSRFGQEDELKFFRINDEVMGGRSISSMDYSPADGLLFSGEINTNGGGFASCRTLGDDVPLGLSNGTQSALIVDATGDGQLHKVMLYTADSWQMSTPSWAHDFLAAKKRSTYRLPLSAFVPSKQGRVARGVQLNGAEITGIGFSLSLYSADGKPNPSFGAGPFRLHVHGVREVRDDGIESRVS